MTRVHALAIVALVAVASVLSGCTSAPSYADAWRHRTELTVTVVNKAEGIQKQYLLGCDNPQRGNHPQEADACLQLMMMENSGFPAAAHNKQCKSIENQKPFEGRLEGYYNGQPVHLRVSMTTDCELRHWGYFDKVFPVEQWKDTPTVTASPAPTSLTRLPL